MREQMRLLSVDDDPAILTLIGKVAHDLGYSVEALTSSNSFMTTYVRVKPHVITLDIFMPDKDGIELIRWLADIGSMARVIIISGSDTKYAMMAEELGSWSGSLKISRLGKPFGIASLRNELIKEQLAETDPLDRSRP